MITLGLEGTAHTTSASVLDEKKIYSMESRTFRPAKGGINPREAANFHFENVVDVIRKAISQSGFSSGDIQLIGFSKGPGLPPSLKITAVAARALALKLNIPIVGVNHPLGHIEIGRRETGSVDPVMLYVSGGNTQIIAHRKGRYRVLGETLDIGIGNLLDKIARDMGYAFPGGPEIEKLAKGGEKLLNLPYSVNGMDCSFSGIYTAAKNHLQKGERKKDVAYSVQEISFAMLVETLERALYTSGKGEMLLAGGVARNNRLKEMIGIMAQEAGVDVFETPEKYCMDNGAMIGQAAILTYEKFGGQKIEDTAIDQMYRIDEVDAPWVNEVHIKYRNMGAESTITEVKFLDYLTVTKERTRKSYRNTELDSDIREKRMKNEITCLYRMMNAGINVPAVFSMDRDALRFEMERIEGIQISNMESLNGQVIEEIAQAVSTLHQNNIVHGDLTLNNIIIRDGVLYFLDPSMGKVTVNKTEMAYDLRLLKESIISVYGIDPYREMEEVYISYGEKCREVVMELNDMEKRRRYV
ncbi:MAG: bifunctional N(6)-L-threonylcarbamoyladenine synthase/serine/threonine protein kinase [Cuniculiplasma sp.]